MNIHKLTIASTHNLAAIGGLFPPDLQFNSYHKTSPVFPLLGPLLGPNFNSVRIHEKRHTRINHLVSSVNTSTHSKVVIILVLYQVPFNLRAILPQHDRPCFRQNVRKLGISSLTVQSVASNSSLTFWSSLVISQTAVRNRGHRE
jgi:hypothetical protein